MARGRVHPPVRRDILGRVHLARRNLLHEHDGRVPSVPQRVPICHRERSPPLSPAATSFPLTAFLPPPLPHRAFHYTPSIHTRGPRGPRTHAGAGLPPNRHAHFVERERERCGVQASLHAFHERRLGALALDDARCEVLGRQL